MNAVVQTRRNSQYADELWGDLPKTNPDLVAMIDYFNSGERGMKTVCPHCGTTALIRSSKQMSKLVKHAMCACLNVVCGHTFVISVEAIRTISPPAFPDHLVASQLRQSDRCKGILEPGENEQHERIKDGEAMT